MRKADREITDRAELEALLRKANVVHLGLWNGEQVYVVPMNYGYRDQALYLHSAVEGRKIDILKRHPQVCFTVTGEQQVNEGEQACGWSTSFASIIGYGVATFLESKEEKIDGLNALMAQFSDRPMEYREDVLPITAVIRIDITEMTGKKH